MAQHRAEGPSAVRHQRGNTSMKKLITTAIVVAATLSTGACNMDTTSTVAGGERPRHAAGAKAKSAPTFTVAQENAMDSAESYLEMSGFSHDGLIQQLSSKFGDGYKKSDAKFAVNHV